MFGPRHTIESVTQEVVDGLEEGTIILRPEEPTDADVEDFESMMKTTLARYRRREVALLTASILGAAVSILIALVQIGEPHARWAIMLVPCIGGALMGFVFGYKTRERSIELKTYIRVLKMAGPSTARRLVLRVAPQLRERGPAP